MCEDKRERNLNDANRQIFGKEREKRENSEHMTVMIIREVLSIDDQKMERMTVQMISIGKNIQIHTIHKLSSEEKIYV